MTRKRPKQPMNSISRLDQRCHPQPMFGLSTDIAFFCGNALESSPYEALFHSEKAAAAFTDPPYNVPIDGHVSGNGQTTHREFPMAAGEMSVAGFTDFLSNSMVQICAHTVLGALIYTCMDWRHLMKVHNAARASECDLLNLCVWVKTNGGLGSLYRSRHELVFVLRNGKASACEQCPALQLWTKPDKCLDYASVSTFGRGNSERNLHPTVKPILLVADAILEPQRRPGQLEQHRAAEAKMRRAGFLGHHPPRDKEHHLASPKCRRESTPVCDAPVFIDSGCQLLTFRSGELHRSDDLRIGRASAQIAGQVMADLVIVWRRMRIE
jgi:hypothetical protein